MMSSQNLTNASEIFAIVQQISSHINRDRIQGILNRVKDLTIEESQLVVNLLDTALEKHHQLLKRADHVLLLLTKISSSANVLAHNRTISSEHITPDSQQSSDVYRILGQSGICVTVVQRGKKGTSAVVSEGLRTWIHLSHANILPIYGAFLEGEDGPVSLVSPQTAEGNIVDHTKTVSQAARMPLISDVIEGLCYLHSMNVVHGDLNPDSVLIVHDGRAIITGLDRLSDSQDSDSTSVRYSAPEVLDEDDAHPTTASDVWSLGCVIYEVLSGKVPFYQIRREVKVGVAIATGKKPVRPSQGVNGMEEINDAIWRPVLPCWEFEAGDRPSCLQFQVSLNAVFRAGRPAPKSLVPPEAFAPKTASSKIMRSILTRVLGPELAMSPPSKIPEHLQKSLSGLADSLTRAETVAAAAKKLSPDDVQLLVDIADLLIMEGSLTSYHRNPAVALLKCVIMSTHIFPRRYAINCVRYDPTPVVDDNFVRVYKGCDLNVCINMGVGPGYFSELVQSLTFSAYWSHPNILPLYGVFNEDTGEPPRFCFASPYMKNGLLRDYAPRLPQKERLNLILDVISALSYLHGLFAGHGNLRGDMVLISDQGCAVVCDADDRGSSYAIIWPICTPEVYALRFTPPESLRTWVYTRESDIWQFGCLVYEVLSRKSPYHQYTEASEIRPVLSRGETPVRPIPTDDGVDQISNQLWDLIMGCCTPEPENRLTMLEIHTLLEEMEIPDDRAEATTLLGIEALNLRSPPEINWDGVKGLLSKIQVELLRNRLSKLIQNHTKDVAAVVTELNAGDTRIFVDFLDLALENHIAISNERNRVLALLSRITTSTHIFPNRYELREIKYKPLPIARGGFGTVHRGVSDPNICVKMITKVDSGALMDVVKELIMWAHSSHPNILPFYGIFIDEHKHLCLVSPFMNKGNLHNYAPQLPQNKRLPFLSDVIKGLAYLHGLGIVHTDLKGENVLISDEGYGLITDFGASHVTTTTAKGGVTDTFVASTLRFTAPEIVLYPHLQPTQECDIWSFGCLCYEVLSRKLPYYEYGLEAQIIAALARMQPPKRPNFNTTTSDDWHEFDEQDWDEIDDPNWSLIKRCCAPQPEDRPNASQVEEMIVDLKIWDDRPKDKDRPGADILRLRPNYNVDLNRAGELLNQLLVQFLAQSMLHYSINDVIAAVMELDLTDDDAIALVEFWDLVVKDHLFTTDEKDHPLALLSALICFIRRFPHRYFVETFIAYDLVLIGSGSFGKVHQGSDPSFCIKVTDGEGFLTTALSEPCINSIIASLYLSHPNILPCYGIGLGRGSPVLVSPLMKNGNLNNYAHSLPQKLRILLILDVIESIMYSHALGIIHGNLKGENVLVSDEGRALVTDFKPYSINVAAAEGGPTGPYVTSTLRFTAPELVINSQMLPTSKSDIWSIGCLIYLVFSRKVPFYQYPDDAEIRSTLSRREFPARPILTDDGAEEIDDLSWDLITKCCKPEAEDRPTLRDIKQWLSSLDIQDNRSPAKPFPGDDILKYRRPHPGVDVEKVEEIFDQIKSQLSQVRQDGDEDIGTMSD